MWASIMPIYFHISKIDLGKSVVLVPKMPSSAGPDEGDSSRVCFAPTIEKCLCSISGMTTVTYENVFREFRPYGKKLAVNPTVYTTNQSLKRPPKIKSDFALTGEMWSLKDIEVNRAGYVCLRSLILKSKVKVVRTSISTITAPELALFSAFCTASHKRIVNDR